MARRTRQPPPTPAASETPRKAWTPKLIGNSEALAGAAMELEVERIDPVKKVLLEQISKLLATYDNEGLAEFLGTLGEIMMNRAESRVPRCPPQEHWDRVAARNKARGERRDA